MRLYPTTGLGVVACVLAAGGPWPRTRGDDDPKPEPPPAAVKQLLDQYLKAAAEKDVPGMTALAGVPWLDRDRMLVRDAANLGKAVGRAAAQFPAAKGKRKVDAVPYKQVRKRVEAEADRKVLDELLGEDGWVAMVASGDDLFSARPS
jgi:hypothetical protein